ncbi:hypothetical protein TPL01_12880 [Sulfuriferula plumbiphila]|uniref:Uncharacterized protein n=1 Tax=Sulfuriferula plumbiphila TaxID=171865 RepID=A0A512L6N8_9PROT|nr:hypothetical protein [Sulfuriferula plumbiphila]BBP04877.1 hypothetical protein SFPGR_22990 [Sulfuriferula plumbiphila]GEP30150.1 hypothetical protein TPL01_12880 [Sulfuriferula plumbiphila]
MPRDNLLKGRVSLPRQACHVTACTEARRPIFRDFACARLLVTEMRRLHEAELLGSLAGKLEASRTGDAVSLYRRVVPPIVEQTSNAAYDEAIKLIRKMGGLMKAQNQSRQFGDYLAELRVQFKPKRNFIKLLGGAECCEMSADASILFSKIARSLSDPIGTGRVVLVSRTSYKISITY